MPQKLRNLKIKIFADGADIKALQRLAYSPLISGFTTNPTLMRKAGVNNYQAFARELVAVAKNRPVSFEVLADDFNIMERQAHKIAGWGENVFVKIPVTNSEGKSCAPLIMKLSKAGIKQNVTAVLTLEQVKCVADSLAGGPHAFISIFAGRIADTGIDPLPIVEAANQYLAEYTNIGTIWASPREILNLIQAEQVNCSAITLTADLLNKLDLIGKSLEEFSLDTVKMFLRDSLAANFSLNDEQTDKTQEATFLVDGATVRKFA